MVQSWGRQNRSFAGLVDELDDRLRRDPIIIDLRTPKHVVVPRWAGLVFICALIVAASAFALDVGINRCEYAEPVCAIEHLDIDAILLAIPDADLFRELPPIDLVDPNDDMTLAEVLRHESLDGIDPLDLIRNSEVDRVLNHLD